MSHLGGQLGVTVEELTTFFDGDAESVLGFIESIGTPRDVAVARHLPFTSRVVMLHQLVQQALKTPGNGSPAR